MRRAIPSEKLRTQPRDGLDFTALEKIVLQRILRLPSRRARSLPFSALELCTPLVSAVTGLPSKGWLADRGKSHGGSDNLRTVPATDLDRVIHHRRDVDSVPPLLLQAIDDTELGRKEESCCSSLAALLTVHEYKPNLGSPSGDHAAEKAERPSLPLHSPTVPAYLRSRTIVATECARNCFVVTLPGTVIFSTTPASYTSDATQKKRPQPHFRETHHLQGRFLGHFLCSFPPFPCSLFSLASLGPGTVTALNVHPPVTPRRE